MIQEITDRRSIRKYEDRPVNDEAIAALIESARIAPSGSNTQPWHFIIVRSPEMRKKLAEASHGQQWMTTAPVHIACVADIRSRIPGSQELYLDEQSSLLEVKQIIRDTSIAIEHIVLEAESMGLGSCWIAWFEQNKIRPLLQIPPDKYVVCVLTIGYPAEEPAARPRKRIEEILHYETW